MDHKTYLQPSCFIGNFNLFKTKQKLYDYSTSGGVADLLGRTCKKAAEKITFLSPFGNSTVIQFRFLFSMILAVAEKYNMKLLTHNMLTSKCMKAVTTGYPLAIQARDVKVIMSRLCDCAWKKLSSGERGWVQPGFHCASDSKNWLGLPLPRRRAARTSWRLTKGAFFQSVTLTGLLETCIWSDNPMITFQGDPWELRGRLGLPEKGTSCSVGGKSKLRVNKLLCPNKATQIHPAYYTGSKFKKAFLCPDWGDQRRPGLSWDFKKVPRHRRDSQHAAKRRRNLISPVCLVF